MNRSMAFFVFALGMIFAAKGGICENQGTGFASITPTEMTIYCLDPDRNQGKWNCGDSIPLTFKLFADGASKVVIKNKHSSFELKDGNSIDNNEQVEIQLVHYKDNRWKGDNNVLKIETGDDSGSVTDNEITIVIYSEEEGKEDEILSRWNISLMVTLELD